MRNSVYIVAMAKHDEAWAKWEQVRELLDSFTPDVPENKDWTRVTRKGHCIRSTKEMFKWDGENDNDNKPFVFLANEKITTENFLCSPYWQCALGGRTFGDIGSETGDWRPFYRRGGQEIKETIHTAEQKLSFWVNPIVLHLDLYENNEVLNHFCKSLVDNDLFEIQIIPDWDESDYGRYLCKMMLREIHRKHQWNLPNSLVRKIFFPAYDTLDSALFEILDRLGGFFHVKDFGSRLPIIAFCPPSTPPLSPIAESLGEYICRVIHFVWEKRDTHPRPLSSPQEWRTMNVKVDDTESWDGVFEAIQDRCGSHCDALNLPLKFIDIFRNHDEKAEERLSFLLPRNNGVFDVIRFIERFAEHFVIPHSPLLFELPNTDFFDLEQSHIQTYNRLRKDWSFDLIKSQPGGAATFFRRLLMTDVETQTSPDTRYRFMWQYAWHDALWLCNANVRFCFSNKGNSSRFGTFRIGYSRLNSNDPPPENAQMSQITFAPAVR